MNCKLGELVAECRRPRRGARRLEVLPGLADEPRLVVGLRAEWAGAAGGDLQLATMNAVDGSDATRAQALGFGGALQTAKRLAPGGDDRSLKRHSSDAIAAVAAEWNSPNHAVAVKVRQAEAQGAVLKEIKASIDECHSRGA